MAGAGGSSRPVFSTEFCALFCALSHTEDDKKRKTTSARTDFPMNCPGAKICLLLASTPLLLEGFARRGSVFLARKISQPQSTCIYTSTRNFRGFPMISSIFVEQKAVLPASAMRLIFLLFALLALASTTVPAQAQDTPQQAPANPNQQEAPPEAGGPQNDVGPYAVPKKTDAPPPPAPEKPKKIENMPNYAISVDVPVVNLDVLVP